ncbi:hypothetical protein [Teredinibacter franksiae]|uniref:hypothetical protein n=1 Tax=Teredinibacter franksiae TaxID=2761453 RepID=UPI00162A72D0|nr:hypothetical protein [Teredinibacter franksiae]
MKIKKYVAGFVLLSIAVLSHAQSSSVCPAVNCDCGSLQNQAWQELCITHETKIKKKCAANSNTPIDFCSVHGPSAKPLPFTLKYTDIQMLPQESIKASDQLIMESYSQIDADLKHIKSRVDNLYFKESIALIKALEGKIEGLFSSQRQVTASWAANDSDGKAVGAWRRYAENTEKLAEAEYAFGKALWEQYQKADSNLKKAYRVVGFKVLRMAGESYEMAGLSYSGGEKNKSAAEAWISGAEVAKSILEAKKESDANASHVDFYQYQAASRLHRAGYHWALANKEKDALEALTAAQEIAPEAELEALIASETAKTEGDLFQLLQ